MGGVGVGRHVYRRALAVRMLLLIELYHAPALAAARDRERENHDAPSSAFVPPPGSFVLFYIGIRSLLQDATGAVPRGGSVALPLWWEGEGGDSFWLMRFGRRTAIISRVTSERCCMVIALPTATQKEP